MNTLLDPADPRLATLVLKSGAHKSVDEGMCFMEAVAWLRGQSFTDHPVCVANTIGAAGRALNDGIADEAHNLIAGLDPTASDMFLLPPGSHTLAATGADIDVGHSDAWV